MRIRPYACQHVAVLYIKHGLSIVIMFFRWCGGCGSKKAGLMNMLEAQNTLVSILNPTVLTCVPSHAGEATRRLVDCVLL